MTLLEEFTLEGLHKFAVENGLVNAEEMLTPRRVGIALKKHDDPASQLVSMSLKDSQQNELSASTLYKALAQAHGMMYEKIDNLSIDAQLATGTISKEFARKRMVLPLRRENGTVIVAIGNPLDQDVRTTIEGLISDPIEFHLAFAGDVIQSVREFFGLRSNLRKAGASLQKSTAQVNNLEQLLRVRSDAELDQSEHHVINAVEYLFRYAVEQRASDIHFEPKRDTGVIRLRIDGIMHVANTVPMHVYRALVSRIKTISRMDIAERRKPQDGRIKLAGLNEDIEMRVSTLPLVFGEKVVLRIFDPGRIVDDFSLLGFSGSDEQKLQQMLRSGNGVIAVTGPTGSGKSTTLYCALQQLSKQPLNIVTVEDPVEAVIESLNQTPVQSQIGYSFAQALRTILRQDPDVIMVGEIRDAETARYAIQAALTGHLVLTTLHTNDALAAVGRLLDLDVDRFFLAQVLRGLTAQRLVRKVCPDCSVMEEMTVTVAGALGLETLPEGATVSKGEGCENCRNTGYTGRTTINEVVLITPEISEAIHSGCSHAELIEVAKKSGYTPLRESAVEAVLKGVTSVDEAMRILSGAVA